MLLRVELNRMKSVVRENVLEIYCGRRWTQIEVGEMSNTDVGKTAKSTLEGRGYGLPDIHPKNLVEHTIIKITKNEYTYHHTLIFY